MTRTSPIAAALRVLGRKGRSTSAHDCTSVQILAQLVKEGKITVGESKFSQGSMLELKVPRNVSPQRIYWEADTFSYSYPLGKVSLKYYLTEKDRNERLKKAKEENDESAKEKLASIVVGASAVELVFKLVSELGVIVRDPLGWVVDIFNKPNLDKKIKDLEKEMGKMSGDMKKEIGKFTEMSGDLKKLSDDMATLKKTSWGEI